MKKAEIISKMAEKAGIGVGQAKEALDTFVGIVETSLKKQGKLAIIGFGTFSVTKRKARKGRNPRTGEEIKIKASKGVRFSAGKKLKEKI